MGEIIKKGVDEMMAFKSGLGSVETEEDVNKPEENEVDKGEEINEEEEEVVEEETIEETKPEDDGKSGIDYKALWEKESKEKEELLKAVTNPKQTQPVQQQEGVVTPPAAVRFLDGSDVKDDDFYQLTNDKGKFVEFLNDFGNKVRVKTAEEIIQTVPGIAQGVASFTVTLSEMNRQFFQDHPELTPIKKLVSATADEMIKERGVNDLSGYEKLLGELPEVMKEKFDLGNIGKPAKKKTPKQAKPGGSRPPRQTDQDDGLTPLQKDIKAALEYSKQHGGV
jgi:hypothetical protein